MPTSAPTFQRIALAQLVENPRNPRKHFDEAKHLELVASVALQGVLEPLLVRPVAKGFEVVAGARRLRAARAAKAADVPCMVQARTDVEAAECALTENLERSDLTALEEGDAFRDLVTAHKHTVESLVKLTGKSRTVVFGRLKLAELTGETRKLVAAGKLSASIGELVARLPTEQGRTEALERLRDTVSCSMMEGDEEDDLSGLPFRHAKEVLEEEFLLRLKDAPFDAKDPLLAAVGSCDVCPRRTGANPALFPGVKDDTCLDSPCWAKKKAAGKATLKRELAEKGVELLPDGEKLFDNYSGELRSERYVTTGAQAPGVEKTWKQLLGDRVPVAVAVDKSGKQHRLVDQKAARILLAEVDAKAAVKVEKAALEKSGPAPIDWQKRQAAEAAARVIADRVEHLVRVRARPHFTLEKALDLWLLGLESAGYDKVQAFEAAGLDAKTKISALKPAQKAALLFGHAFLAIGGSRLEPLLAVCAKAAKLDLKKLRKQSAAAVAGTCWVCGCVEAKACKGGCSWTDDAKVLCSRCVGG